jgi:hypothetical protein
MRTIIQTGSLLVILIREYVEVTLPVPSRYDRETRLDWLLIHVIHS